MFKLLFLILICAFAETELKAATYYVAQTGNDASSGTQTQPWRTIQHAASKIAPGDTVNIQAGSYNETVTITTPGNSGAPVTFQGSGHPVIVGNLFIKGAYVTVSGVTVSPPSAGGYRAIDIEGSYNTLSNSIVTNYGATASDKACAISTGGSFNTVDRCWILNLNDIDAFHIWGHDITISNNTVNQLNQVNYNLNHTDFVQTWGSDASRIAYNVLFIGNLVTNSTCQLGNTETDGNPNLHDWTFANNVFVNIGHAFFSGLPNTFFYNNLFDNCGSGQGYAVSLYTQTNYSSIGDKFVNNIFTNNQKDIDLHTTSPNQLALVSNNYFAAANYAPVKNGEYMGVNYINGGTPNFSSAAGLNFVPQSGSLLIDAGIPIATFNIDKNGVKRPSTAWTIGPHESGSAPPAAPSALLH
jgi:hypothetical protein